MHHKLHPNNISLADTRNAIGWVYLFYVKFYANPQRAFNDDTYPPDRY